MRTLVIGLVMLLGCVDVAAADIGPALDAAARDIGAVAVPIPCMDPDGPGPKPCAPIPAIVEPEDNPSWWVTTGWDAARSSIPAAVLLVAFALVSVARRRFPPAREGTTGIVTATALAAIGTALGGLLAGVDVGTAIGWALSAVLGGKLLATQPKAVA